MKYIDSEKLIAILEERRAQKDQLYERYGDPVDSARADELTEVIDIIDSLQQEQQEVDFEKEFNDFLNNVEGVPRMWHSDEQIEWAKDIARHFTEWGAIHLNARK